MKKKEKNVSPYMGSVKVGPKGQIVIPKEIRDMFGIEPGDSLVILAHPNKGIAIERPSLFEKLTEAIFSGKSTQLHDEQVTSSDDDNKKFAKEMNDVLSNIKESQDE